jgi:hypothetical protein
MRHLGVGKPSGSHVAEILGSGQPALLALLLVRRGLALGNGFFGVEQLFAGHRQGNAGRPVTADGQRFPPAVETVIVAEGDGTGCRYRHVHAVTVGCLVSQ